MTDLNARVVVSATDHVSGPLGAIAGKFGALHKSMNATIGAAGLAMKSAGRSMTMAITLPSALAVKAAADWQTAMLDWKKAADELFDPAVYERARQAIKTLSTQLPLSQVELTQLAAAASRAGVAFNDVQRFVELAAKTADAFDMSAEDAGSALASIKQSARLSNDQLNILIGRMDLLENSMNVRGRQLINFANQIGALGRQAGFSNAEIAAMGATMIDAGTEVSKAATSTKNLFKTLTGGLSLSKQNLAVFERLGIDADNFAKQVQQEPVKALGMLRDKLNEVIPAHQRLGALFDLFKDQAAPAIALLFQNWDKYLSALKAVKDEQKAANQLDRSFAVTMGELNNRLKISRNHLVNITDTFASRWMPTLDRALERADKWMASLEQQPKALQAVADGVGLLAAAGPALWLLGGALSGITKAVGAMAASFAWMGRMGALRLGTWGVIVAGLVEAGRAASDAWAADLAPRWERLQEASSKLADSLVRLAGVAVPEGKGWERIQDWFDSEVVKGMAQALDQLAGAIESLRVLIEKPLDFGNWARFLGFAPSHPGEAPTKLPGYEFGQKLRKHLGPVAPFAGVKALGDTIESAQKGAQLPALPSWEQFSGASGPSVPSVPRGIAGTARAMQEQQSPLIRDLGKSGAPINVDVTGRVDAQLRGRGQVDVNVRVEGPGQVTGLNATDDGGSIEVNVGTSNVGGDQP